MSWLLDITIILTATVVLWLVARMLCRHRTRRSKAVSGHLLRKRGPLTYYRVALTDGRRSRRFWTLRGAMGYLRRNTHPAPDPKPARRADRPRGLQWGQPMIERTDRWN